MGRQAERLFAQLFAAHLAVGAERCARIGQQTRQCNFCTALAALAEAAFLQPFEGRLQLQIAAVQGGALAGCHRLLLHRIHARQPPDAGMIQHHRAG